MCSIYPVYINCLISYIGYCFLVLSPNIGTSLWTQASEKGNCYCNTDVLQFWNSSKSTSLSDHSLWLYLVTSVTCLLNFKTISWATFRTGGFKICLKATWAAPDTKPLDPSGKKKHKKKPEAPPSLSLRCDWTWTLQTKTVLKLLCAADTNHSLILSLCADWRSSPNTPVQVRLASWAEVCLRSLSLALDAQNQLCKSQDVLINMQWCKVFKALHFLSEQLFSELTLTSFWTAQPHQESPEVTASSKGFGSLKLNSWVWLSAELKHTQLCVWWCGERRR